MKLGQLLLKLRFVISLSSQVLEIVSSLSSACHHSLSSIGGISRWYNGCDNAIER